MWILLGGGVLLLFSNLGSAEPSAGGGSSAGGRLGSVGYSDPQTGIPQFGFSFPEVPEGFFGTETLNPFSDDTKKSYHQVVTGDFSTDFKIAQAKRDFEEKGFAQPYTKNPTLNPILNNLLTGTPYRRGSNIIDLTSKKESSKSSFNEDFMSGKMREDNLNRSPINYSKKRGSLGRGQIVVSATKYKSYQDRFKDTKKKAQAFQKMINEKRGY